MTAAKFPQPDALLTLTPIRGVALARLLGKVRACTACAAHLPLGPRPVVRVGPAARVLIIGQAPGTKVHQTGVPWNDPSGDRLREWLKVARDAFYDTGRFAIMPMGFCYPGRDARGGDAPPRPECAPLWHTRIKALLPGIRLTLLVGRYSQAYYLGTESQPLADTVRDWRRFVAQGFFPLPHPSPRNRLWLKQRPWFEKQVVPALRRAVNSALY